MVSSLGVGTTLMLLCIVGCGTVNISLSCCGCALYYKFMICYYCCERGELQVHILGLVIRPELR